MNLQTFKALKSATEGNIHDLILWQALTDIDPPDRMVKFAGPSDIVTLTDAIQGNALGVTVTISPKRESEGTATVANPIAISGWDDITVTVKSSDEEDAETRTYNVDLGSAGPAYQGTLDIVNGTLTVTGILRTFNTKDMNNDRENYPGWQNAGVRAMYGANLVRQFNTTLNIGKIFAINTNNGDDKLYLANGVYGLTQTEWKKKKQEIQIIFPLDTPEVYTIDPVTISLFRAKNVISADSGKISIQYNAHKK